MQQVGIEHEDVARGACELHGPGLVVDGGRRVARRRAMTAGDETRCAVAGTEVVEKGQRDRRIAGALRGQVAVQTLSTASRQRFAALDLREEEAFADQRADRGQQWRQPADGLHVRIEIQHRMAPVRAARHQPLFRRFRARIERVAKIVQPFRRDRATEQGIAVPMESIAVDHGAIGLVHSLSVLTGWIFTRVTIRER